MTDAGRASAEEEIRRKYGFEKLESQLSYYMATDNITAVETTLNDRLTLELEPLYQQLEMQKGVSEQIYDQLTASEKIEWDLAISKTENSIQERKDIATYRNGIITTAMQNGVPIPSYVVQELNRASSVEEVNQILARNNISLVKPTTGDGVPTVKSINGVDMQWNPTTRKWEPIAGGTMAPDYQSGLVERTISSAQGLLDIAVDKPSIFGRTAALPLPDFARSDEFRNYSAQLETLKANVFTSQLQAMRNASKTGGAVGNVSDREGDRFANALGALSMSQSPENVQKQLTILIDSSRKWQEAVNKAGYQPASGSTVTAPDGTQIIITD